ncbi:STAS domain-containing protein [Streptomyces sp. NBC_01527]|uniref:STAS domain-containing protein n=1 Tax=unclassified Streptomyces TaxID=2593676 RepID=UPI002E118FA2|nr:STAS domain-containing protein [Streptomyces sp. NBC_01230]
MRDGRVVLAVTGAVDWATAGALRATASEEIAAGARKLVLDFSLLSFWDSSGMGAVASAYRSASQVGASVALAGLSPTLEKAYRLTGMDTVVPLHRDVCTALTAVTALTAPGSEDLRSAAEGRLGRRGP